MKLSQCLDGELPAFSTEMWRKRSAHQDFASIDRNESEWANNIMYLYTPKNTNGWTPKVPIVEKKFLNKHIQKPTFLGVQLLVFGIV